MLAVVSLLLHRYEEALPPDTVAVTVPLLLPQVVLVGVVEAVMPAVDVTLADEVAEHPLASTTISYWPVVRDVNELDI